MSLLLQDKSVEVWKYEAGQVPTFGIRMDAMEIEDSLFSSKNLTMEGLVTKGRTLSVLGQPLTWLLSCLIYCQVG